MSKNLRVKFCRNKVKTVERAMIPMKNLFTRVRGSLLATAAVYILLGAGLLVYGLTRVIGCIAHKGVSGGMFFRFEVILGLASLAAGIILFLKPELILSILPIVLGAVLLLDGIARVKHAFELKRSGMDFWWHILLMGLLGVAMGVLLLFNPFRAVMTTVRVLGAGMIINGISDIWTYFKTR